MFLNPPLPFITQPPSAGGACAVRRRSKSKRRRTHFFWRFYLRLGRPLLVLVSPEPRSCSSQGLAQQGDLKMKIPTSDLWLKDAPRGAARHRA
jgi:hypothetical protein